MTFPNAVNVPKFKVFLDEIRRQCFMEDIVLYMDNLAVHRSRHVRERMDELGIAYVFNPPYSPEFNGIETVFSTFKDRLKRKRLYAIQHGERFDYINEIKRTFY